MQGKLLQWGVYHFILCIALVFFTEQVLAAATSVGAMAKQISDSFSDIAKLITGTSYLAGLGFAIGAIMKFKQHKDNPTQIPIGTPIALVCIAGALLFLPTLLKVAGGTMFGGGTVAGPTGMIFS
nr:type IV secretion protein IcmD [Legionella yabuuchiae]